MTTLIPRAHVIALANARKATTEQLRREVAAMKAVKVRRRVKAVSRPVGRA